MSLWWVIATGVSPLAYYIPMSGLVILPFSCFVDKSVQEKESIAGLRGFVGIIVGVLSGGREKGGGEVLRVGAGAVDSCKRDKKGGVDGRWGRSRLLKKKWEEKLILI